MKVETCFSVAGWYTNLAQGILRGGAGVVPQFLNMLAGLKINQLMQKYNPHPAVAYEMLTEAEQANIAWARGASKFLDKFGKFLGYASIGLNGLNTINSAYNYKQGTVTGWDVFHDFGMTLNSILGMFPPYTLLSMGFTMLDICYSWALTEYFTNYYVGQTASCL